MHSKLIELLSILILLGCIAVDANAQINDPIEMAKTYPPSLIRSSENGEHLSAIQWQLTRLEALLKQYQHSNETLTERVKVNQEHVQKLQSELPSEVRFIDPSVRSHLIGITMEELLKSRLDVATHESTIDTVTKMLAEKEASRQADGTKKQNSIAIRAAELKIEVATAEYEKIKQLATRGTKSQSETRMAKYTVEVARLELEKALVEAERDLGHGDSELANRLTELRIGVEPIKARIKAAEHFLKTFTDAAKQVAEIDAVKSEVENWKKDKQFVVQELMGLSREADELKVLQRLILKEIKAKQERPSQGKTGQDQKASTDKPFATDDK